MQDANAKIKNGRILLTSTETLANWNREKEREMYTDRRKKKDT
jgi:hypothetical protein